ncbi:cytochrome P450 [Actinokineospora enzanensis]|uniref:cytochrome P450 n=1 Tax=Actinokineospora enzanensis TaxID=155975 RepID=UPI00035DBB02|nr:cytochrome P450 [Actinokineospora enzanensis]
MEAELRLGARLTAQWTILWAMAARGDALARLLSPPWRSDPYPIYAKLRSGGGVHRSPVGLTTIATHELCSKVLRDRRFGVRSTDGVNPPPFAASPLPSEVAMVPSFLEMDPPDHTRLRTLARPAFSPSEIACYRANVKKATHENLDRALALGTFDLMAEFATPLPIRVISDLLGIPGVDAPTFARYGRVLAASLDGIKSVRHARALRTANREMRALFTRLIAERRREPGPDVISGMLAADPDGTISETDLATTCELLLVAGFETTTNLIGNAVWAFARNPEQWDRLCADPGLAGAGVDEVLRYLPPVRLNSRFAHEDTEIGGVPLAKDTMVVVAIGAANRDPAVFTRPDEFDIGRPNRGDHLAFSSGIHYCLGAPLARLEGELALTALAEALPRLRLAGTPRRRPTVVIGGFRSLPVRA